MTEPTLKTFTDADIEGTQPAVKIGLLATVSPEGLPHITLLTTLMACGPARLSFGQFTEGRSMQHVRGNPKAGFLIMGLGRTLWRGRADFTGTANHGPEYDFYNNVPMFRYNAYFGIHTVYYFDLVEHGGKQPLPMNRIVFAALQTLLARSLAFKARGDPVLNPWTRGFLNKLDNLKFLAYVAADGYPRIIPAIQAQALDARRVIFSTSVYRADLRAIPTGAPLAVFGMALTMEDVLVRGRFLGYHRVAGIRTGTVAVDWVYNPMPPVPGQIYPAVPLDPVTKF